MIGKCIKNCFTISLSNWSAVLWLFTFINNSLWNWEYLISFSFSPLTWKIILLSGMSSHCVCSLFSPLLCFLFFLHLFSISPYFLIDFLKLISLLNKNCLLLLLFRIHSRGRDQVFQSHHLRKLDARGLILSFSVISDAKDAPACSCHEGTDCFLCWVEKIPAEVSKISKFLKLDDVHSSFICFKDSSRHYTFFSIFTAE